MMDDIINLNLSRDDIGQIIDGLICRKDAWRNTEAFLEGKVVDCVIEECSHVEEAKAIADRYDEIIERIYQQINK